MKNDPYSEKISTAEFEKLKSKFSHINYLVQTPGWELFMAFISDLEESAKFKSYGEENPNLLFRHTGALQVLGMIKAWATGERAELLEVLQAVDK